MMVRQIKILLYIQLVVAASLALPVSPENKHEKRHIPVSDSVNLIEKVQKESSTSTLDLKITTEEPQNESTAIPGNKTENPLRSLDHDLSSVESKIKVFDFTNPSKEDATIPQVRIGLPFDGPETHIIKVPETYIIRVPQVIIVREPHYIHGDFGASSIPGSFHPFGEYPGIPQAFPSGEHIFDISQLYPSNPIEISQGFEGFPPISGVSEIQGFPGFPGFDEISQGFETQPQEIGTVGINGEKIDHESDSVVVEALSKTKISNNNDKTRMDDGVKANLTSKTNN